METNVYYVGPGHWGYGTGSYHNSLTSFQDLIFFFFTQQTYTQQTYDEVKPKIAKQLHYRSQVMCLCHCSSWLGEGGALGCAPVGLVKVPDVSVHPAINKLYSSTELRLHLTVSSGTVKLSTPLYTVRAGVLHSGLTWKAPFLNSPIRVVCAPGAQVFDVLANSLQTSGRQLDRSTARWAFGVNRSLITLLKSPVMIL